jgi:hypothetical protein
VFIQKSLPASLYPSEALEAAGTTGSCHSTSSWHAAISRIRPRKRIARPARIVPPVIKKRIPVLSAMKIP